MEKLLESTLDIAIRAGQKILEIYEKDFEVDFKVDGSPLTLADQSAHALIQAALEKLDPLIPVLSEESTQAVFQQRLSWNKFWLVDPLDGTKEFVKRNGEFTVNIALIENGEPILGVVHTPVKDVSHYAATGLGSFKKLSDNSTSPLAVKTATKNKIVMVASRSHSGPEVSEYQQNIEMEYGQIEIASMGSSLKICLVAEGAADIYPRLGPTSEWDTAAAHCVLEMAGGRLTDLTGERLKYNKPDILNPWFLASGDNAVDWTRFLGRI
jgi:3'(2'), 5'-bisphosphate nucleotidase